MAAIDPSWAPVIAGGFAIAGAVVGFLGSMLVRFMQTRAEKQQKRAEKFEELVGAVYEHEHWLKIVRSTEGSGRGEGEPAGLSPISKLHAISSVYFPQFETKIKELEVAADTYRMWCLEVGQLMRSGDVNAASKKVAGTQAAVYEPYLKKLNELLGELRAYAKQELQ